MCKKYGAKIKVLMVYIEPTPYILGLIDALINSQLCEIDIIFLGENISQRWDLDLDAGWQILPENRWKKICRLFQLFSKAQYNVVHLAGWGNFLLLLIIFMTKFKRIPLAIETDTPLPHRQFFFKKIIKKLCYPIFFGLADVFLPGGIRQAKYLEYYGVKSNRIIPVHMTVDVAGIKKFANSLTSDDRLFTRQQYGINKNNIVFLYVGRLFSYKGVGDLLSAFEKCTYNNISLLIVGDGDMREEVESAVNNNSRIHYAGRITGMDLIKVYFAADILVLPSHCESWGLVINEAMAVNLPVIVTERVGCVENLVSHNETGLIVESENISKLHDAIELMANSAEKRIDMGKKAGQIIEEWTLENEAKKICYGWKQILGIPKNIPL